MNLIAAWSILLDSTFTTYVTNEKVPVRYRKYILISTVEFTTMLTFIIRYERVH